MQGNRFINPEEEEVIEKGVGIGSIGLRKYPVTRRNVHARFHQPLSFCGANTDGVTRIEMRLRTPIRVRVIQIVPADCSALHRKPSWDPISVLGSDAALSHKT